MRNAWKRSLALLMTLVLLLSLLPAAAFAEEDVAEEPVAEEPVSLSQIEEDSGQLAVDLEENLSEENDEDNLLDGVDLTRNIELLNKEKEYSVNSHQYSAAQLKINWDHIRSVGHQSAGQACACFSYAYMRTILDGKVHYWTEFNSSSGSNQGTAIAPWQGSTWSGYFPSDKNAAFERLYSEISNGKPAAVKVKGTRSSHHYVAVVGFVNVTSSSLSANNFLIIDPCASQFVVENMGGVGYDIKIEEGCYQVTYDTTSQTVGFASSTGSSYYLDLNGYLDGNSVGNISGYGTVDVYINGSLEASGVTDYYTQWPKGTTYEFRNIQPTPGHHYSGVHSGSLSGTIGDAAVSTVLAFETSCALTYKKDSGDVVRDLAPGTQLVEQQYDTRDGEYFVGFSYTPNASDFDVRPGEYINLAQDTTLYPVYISHAEATSGEPALIYNINDFPAEGYTITATTKDVSTTTTESEWGAWSSWSATAVSGSDTRQVETRTAYGWYYFECPNCHAHMHGYGTCWTWCGGCGGTTSASDYHQMYDPTNWNVAQDWYGTGKYYATINGAIWFRWDDGGTQTQYRYRDLVTNTITTNKTYDAYIIRPAVGYTVTFNANGGTGAPAVQTKYQGQALTLSTTVPTRNCHVFQGWATSSTATTAQYQPGGSFTTDANTILYAVWAEGTVTEWSTTKPSGVDDSLIQTKQQYRYADKETTTSTESSISGWTLYDTTTAWSDWSSWSDWSNSSVSATDSRQVETRTAYSYYYFVCSNCGAHMHGSGTCYTWAGGCGSSSVPSGSYSQVYLTTPYSSSSDFHGTGVNYVDSSYGRVFAYTSSSSQYYQSPVTQYRFRTRTQITTYYYYRWKAWSDWSDTVYTATDNRKVESRTLYRYVADGSAVHNWDSGVVTKEASCTEKGVKTYTCTKCGKTQTEEIPALGHSWGTPSYYWSSDNLSVTARRTCSHDANHEESETVNTVPHVSKEPSCLELGETTYTATFVNSAFVKQSKTITNLAALGHNWGEWIVTTAATVDHDGVETRTCSRCGATETRSYSADTVTVTFNANGGSTGTSSMRVLKNGSLSSLPTATRTGYSFNGWFTASSGGTKVTTATTFSQDTTVYAQWTPITYTVTYNANGGTNAPSAQTKTHDVALTLSSQTPSRPNSSAGSYTVTLNANGGSVSPTSLSAARTTSYSFKNWNTAANGSGTSYNPGASYTANAAVTLYAQWNSSTATASVSLPTPTRSGYSFQGWAASSTASSGTTGSYTPSGDVTLYAVWKADTYTVSYNANGGSGEPSAQTKKHDVALTLSSDTPTHASEFAGSYTVTLEPNGGSFGGSMNALRTTNYSFKSWNTARDGSGTSYSPGASYTANADATLYAQWNSSTTTASVNLPTPTREGYTFMGWATSADAASGVIGSYTPSGDVTLYAVWKLARYGKTLTLPAGMTTIESEAFADLPQGVNIVIPDSVENIAKDAFQNSKVIIIAQEDSYAIWWAKRNSIPYIISEA